MTSTSFTTKVDSSTLLSVVTLWTLVLRRAFTLVLKYRAICASASVFAVSSVSALPRCTMYSESG